MTTNPSSVYRLDIPAEKQARLLKGLRLFSLPFVYLLPFLCCTLQISDATLLPVFVLRRLIGGIYVVFLSLVDSCDDSRLVDKFSQVSCLGVK